MQSQLMDLNEAYAKTIYVINQILNRIVGA